MASGFGWTRDVIYDQLDLPTYVAYLGWWAENPPTWLLANAVIRGLGGGDGASAGTRPSAPPDGSTGFKGRKPTKAELWAIPPVTKRPAGDGALSFESQLFAAELGKVGTVSVRRVARDYYQRMCAEMDAGSAARKKAKQGK